VGGRHGWRRGTGTSTDGDRDGTDDRDARKPRDERRRGDEKANARERARAPSFARAARRVESTRLVDAMIPIDGCVTMNGCESKNARGRRTSVVGAVHTFPVGRGTARRRRADAPTRADAVVTFVFKRAPVPSFDTTDGSAQESLVIGNYGCLAVATPSSSLSGAPRFVSSSATTSPATATTRRETKATPTARALVSSPARLAFTLAFASVHSNRRPVAANFSSLESPPRTFAASTSAEPPSRRRRRPSSTARSRRARADARPSDRDGDDDGNDDACVRPAARASSTATGKDTERPPPKLKQNKEKKERGGASDDSREARGSSRSVRCERRASTSRSGGTTRATDARPTEDRTAGGGGPRFQTVGRSVTRVARMNE